MTRARLPGRHCYLSDERDRQSNEVLQGLLIAAIVLTCVAGSVLFWEWLKVHAYA